jgi:Flp pilus assembly protein protease CpaA
MFILISHILGFLGLSAAAIYDLKTTEVPDAASIFVIVSGLLFHGLASWQQGSLTPLIWSVSAGLVFGLYGWGMYYFGMWGGADAFVMTALGFAAPFAINSAPSILYPANLFVNIMLVGFIYTIGFSIYKAARSENIGRKTFAKLAENRRRITLELLGGIVISAAISAYTSLNGAVYFGLIFGLIIATRFLKSIEESEMKTTLPVPEISEGDVVETEKIDMEHVRKENLIGAAISRIEEVTGSKKLASVREKYGYSEIVGITEDEIQRLEEQDIEEVEIKEGIRFVPSFPVALLITDTVGAGVFLMAALIN